MASKGWRFELRHLHLKSGSLQRYADFAVQVRLLVRRQSLPGYWLRVDRIGGSDWLVFGHVPYRLTQADLSTAHGDKSVDNLCADSGIARLSIGESPAGASGNHTCESAAKPRPATHPPSLNFSNRDLTW